MTKADKLIKYIKDKTMKIKKEVEIFDHPEYCGNGMYGTRGVACKKLGSIAGENDCQEFDKVLDFNCDIPQKCDQCKTAYQKAKAKSKQVLKNGR